MTIINMKQVNPALRRLYRQQMNIKQWLLEAGKRNTPQNYLDEAQAELVRIEAEIQALLTTSN